MITHQCLTIIFSDHQDFCFDCLEIMFKLKFQGTSITNSLLQDILMYLDL